VTAFYRRYRPESFQDVIAQDHVTTPLKNALVSGKSHHAYLFSGPRGCGKTTSARILAKCWNCHQGPTDTPCGTCPSCAELANDGGGSLDVVEIDAASHNGVDDARELRERAVFASSRDRYKIFILDGGPIWSRSRGFNALLKILRRILRAREVCLSSTTEPEQSSHHYLSPEHITISFG
jgi:DNA polymerase III, gamma/tau subunits